MTLDNLTPEEEREIELSAEARHRAWKKNREAEKKEKADADCESGNHSYKDDKCTNCKADKPKETPKPRKSLFA